MKRFLKNPFVLFLLACGLIAAGVFAWRQHKVVNPEQRYKLEVVESGELKQSVSANGTLNPVILVNVGTQVSGVVKKLYVDFNDKVEKGQVLLELDPALLNAQVKQSDANVQNAQASLELANANLARSRGLFAQEYVSRQELDQSVQALKAARAQLALARAQNERDRAQMAYSIIRSPVSGVIVARNIDVGQTVAASFQTPTLFQIAQDLSKMQIDSSFAEADIGSIRVGQGVRFNVDAFPNRNFKGGVKQIRLNPTTQQNVVTYNVVISVDNPEQILLPGMTSYVSIVVAQREEALLVPNAALRFKPAEKTGAGGKEKEKGADKPASDKKRGKKRDAASGTVYILQGKELKPVSITLGITDNRNTEVLGGELKAGDKVVVGENQAEENSSSGKNSTVRMRMF
ncbi:MAG: efflux RND transporter periplasmic adaptor subunit [Sulfuricella denitrificans]|nr:efflux RND transporter periplasmic adaptor subunit [Sulfuricella denitrificans]